MLFPFITSNIFHTFHFNYFLYLSVYAYVSLFCYPMINPDKLQNFSKIRLHFFNTDKSFTFSQELRELELRVTPLYVQILTTLNNLFSLWRDIFHFFRSSFFCLFVYFSRGELLVFFITYVFFIAFRYWYSFF